MLLARMFVATVLVLCLSAAVRARADQFVVADVVYTHSAQTTTDSHYRVSPAAGSPANWQSPVDYSTGSVHVLLEVKTKPTSTPTKFQICFEGTPSYACTDQSPSYTAPGTYQWTTQFSAFYYGGDVDWSRGIKQVALILKDTQNNKPQGDPVYVPTDLRVEVAVISKGASFVAPTRDAGAGNDAGASDAGSRDGGMVDAGRAEAGMTGDAAAPDAAISHEDARASEPSDDAQADAAVRLDASSTDESAEDDAIGAATKQSGCSTVHSSQANASPGLWSLSWIALLLVRRRIVSAR